jgi:hypothetical protein
MVISDGGEGRMRKEGKALYLRGTRDVSYVACEWCLVNESTPEALFRTYVYWFSPFGLLPGTDQVGDW